MAQTSACKEKITSDVLEIGYIFIYIYSTYSVHISGLATCRQCRSYDIRRAFSRGEMGFLLLRWFNEVRLLGLSVRQEDKEN